MQAAEFLYETSLFPERQYTFKHALTHEVAYGSLLQEQRRVLHGQILHAVEVMLGDRYMEQVESLAHHALRGEVWDKALLYFRQAGEKAMTHSASREAVICFEQALTALPHLPAQRSLHELAIDLRISLYTARITLGKIERAFDDLHEAETLAEALNDAQRLGRVSYHMAQYLGTQGAYDRARAVGQRALALGTASEDVGTQVSAHFIIGAHAYFLGDYVRTVETLQNAIELVQGDHLYELSFPNIHHTEKSLIVRPENPNQLKFLTFTPTMITLERWIFPFPFTSRDKVSDHASHRLCPSRIHRNMVPLTSRHADGTHCFETSGRRL
ncbi:MAG: hypothetical protein O6944_02175 [Gammaproteobacteria bacterium]|nr:hypothetical protein [Gammaproteobacteria bacterium]